MNLITCKTCGIVVDINYIEFANIILPDLPDVPYYLTDVYYYICPLCKTYIDDMGNDVKTHMLGLAN